MLLRSPIDVANFTAFVTYTPLREPEWSTTAPRIYAQETNLASRSRGGQIADIVHELTHAALSGRGGPFSPVWLHEGLAEYVRLNRPAAVPVTRGKPDRLPDTAAFSSADVATLRKAYDASTSAVSYLARLKGPDAPFALFDAIGQQRNVAGSPSYNVDAAFKQVLGMSLKDFEKAWSASR